MEHGTKAVRTPEEIAHTAVAAEMHEVQIESNLAKRPKQYARFRGVSNGDRGCLSAIVVVGAILVTPWNAGVAVVMLICGVCLAI